MRHARRQVAFGAVLAVVVVLAALAIFIATNREPPPPPPPVSVPGGATPAPSTSPTVGPPRRSPNE